MSARTFRLALKRRTLLAWARLVLPAVLLVVPNSGGPLAFSSPRPGGARGGAKSVANVALSAPRTDSRASGDAKDLAALASQVAAMWRSDPYSHLMWEKFADKLGGGTRDPKRHSEEFLQQFIALYSEERATDLTLEDLKDITYSAQGRIQWETYSEEYGIGLENPALFPERFVQEFISKQKEGLLPLPEMPTDRILEEWDSVIRENPEAEGTWKGFTKHLGGGTTNPKRHTRALVEAFLGRFRPRVDKSTLRELDQRRQTSPMVASQWIEYKNLNYNSQTERDFVLDESLVRRFLTAHSEGSLPQVEMATDELVQEILIVFTEHERSKYQWNGYVQKLARGLSAIRDPKLHSASSLHTFLSSYRART